MSKRFDVNDPRLTAYALGELDEKDRAEVEAELAKNQAAREAVAEIHAAADLLTRELQQEPAGALAPTMVRCPPGNRLCNIVLPLSRERGSAILPCNAGVSRTIGARRSLLNVSDISIVGWTIRIGAGSWSM